MSEQFCFIRNKKSCKLKNNGTAQAETSLNPSQNKIKPGVMSSITPVSTSSIPYFECDLQIFREFKLDSFKSVCVNIYVTVS